MAIVKGFTVVQHRTPLPGAELQQEMQAGHEQIPAAREYVGAPKLDAASPFAVRQRRWM